MGSLICVALLLGKGQPSKTGGGHYPKARVTEVVVHWGTFLEAVYCNLPLAPNDPCLSIMQNSSKPKAPSLKYQAHA